MELAGEDAGHVESEFFAALVPFGVEPLVPEGHAHDLGGGVAGDVGGAEDGAIELGDVKDVALDVMGAALFLLMAFVHARHSAVGNRQSAQQAEVVGGRC